MKRIFISCGHGGTDGGSIGADKSAERDRTMALGNDIKSYLISKYKFIVDTMQEKDAKAKFQTTKISGYDYRCSIHFNAFNKTATGAEVLYKDSINKNTAAELSRNLAIAMGITDRGPKARTDLSMLNNGYPHLYEICFHDNQSDLAKFNNNLAKVIAVIGDFIAKMVGESINGSIPNSTSNSVPNTGHFPYTVRVTAESLSVRSGAGDGFPVVMVIRDKGVYTIVEEKNGWGRLKSGAGWISLAYTIRV